jgi:hypothetical protein
MLTLSAPLSRTPATQQPALAPKIESVSSPAVSERRRSSNSHSFPGGNHTIDAHEIRDIVGFDYAWSHKDDGPPEPGWSGPRVGPAAARLQQGAPEVAADQAGGAHGESRRSLKHARVTLLLAKVSMLVRVL